MNKKKVVTILLAISLLALALSILVYAAAHTIYSPIADNTETLEINAEIEKSLDGSTWNTVGSTGTIEDWFCRLRTTSIGYSGSETVVWQLEKSADEGTTWNEVVGVAVSTSVTFTGAANQIVYATSDGTVTGNKDWAESFDETAWYRVAVSNAHLP